jgi:hypothetical protein
MKITRHRLRQIIKEEVRRALSENSPGEIMTGLNNLLISAKKKMDNYMEDLSDLPVGDHEITVRINLKDPELSTTVDVENEVIQHAYEKSLNAVLDWVRNPYASTIGGPKALHSDEEIESYRQAVSAAREAGKDQYAMRIGYTVSAPPEVQTLGFEDDEVKGGDSLGDFGSELGDFDL